MGVQVRWAGSILSAEAALEPSTHTTMRTLALLLLAGTLGGCHTLRSLDQSGRLANARCNPRVVAAILNTDAPLTRDERAYVEKCGIRFAAPAE